MMIAFLAGLFVGTILSTFVIAIITVAKHADEQEDSFWKDIDDGEL